jgi:hypothetical protein
MKNEKTLPVALVLLGLLGTVFVLSTSKTGEGTGKVVQKPIAENITSNTSHIMLKVSIPCTGHAQLISGGLKNISGVTEVQYTEPDIFKVGYDPSKTSAREILSMDLFREYPAAAQMSADIKYSGLEAGV